MTLTGADVKALLAMVLVTSIVIVGKLSGHSDVNEMQTIGASLVAGLGGLAAGYGIAKKGAEK
jgi:hypothetical protein